MVYGVFDHLNPRRILKEGTVMAENRNNRNPETDAKSPVLVIERFFNTPLELLWKAWTEPEYFKRWWGPNGFKCPFSKIDLRVDGVYLSCMRAPDGKDYWSTGVYREIVPLSRLVMTDSFAAEKGNVVLASYYGFGTDFPYELQVDVTFEVKEGKSGFIMRHYGIPLKDQDNTETGWSQSFDKLAESLKGEIS
jgi:uncharacterized protein YndB with AHSA1/START domain